MHFSNGEVFSTLYDWNIHILMHVYLFIDKACFVLASYRYLQIRVVARAMCRKMKVPVKVQYS